AGNLAALEDQMPSRPMQPTLPPMTKAELLTRLPNPQVGLPPLQGALTPPPHSASQPTSAPQPPAYAPPAPVQPTIALGVSQTPEKKPMSGAVKAIVAALVVAAAVA